MPIGPITRNSLSIGHQKITLSSERERSEARVQNEQGTEGAVPSARASGAVLSSRLLAVSILRACVMVVKKPYLRMARAHVSSVECDAGVMDGASLTFGSVSSASGLKNPVRVASRLLRTQQSGRLSLDREPPMTLSGRGAYLWAKVVISKKCDVLNRFPIKL